MPNLALAWPLTQHGVTCVIAGATTKKQVESNAKAMVLELEPKVGANLTKATDALKKAMGKNID